MKRSDWIGRTLGVAWRKVNALTLLMLIFSASAQAQKHFDYGRKMIEISGSWLHEYLDAFLWSRGYYPNLYPAPADPFAGVPQQFKRETELAVAFLKIAGELPPIEFRDGKDKIFVLKAGEPPRVAVTGSGKSDPIYFNKALISDHNRFVYADAIALWIHELGHKIKLTNPELNITQHEIDELGARLGERFRYLARIHEVPGFKILAVTPIPVSREGHAFVGPVRHWRLQTTLAILKDGRWLDYTAEFDKQLDGLMHPYVKHLESRRRIMDVLVMKENAGEVDLRLELRTTRIAKKPEDPTPITDMGVNHFKSARLKLSRDLKTFDLSRYINEPYPNELIHDAEAELSDFRISVDRKTLSGKYQLHLKNQTHFNASGYPRSTFTILALADGEPVRLKAEVHWYMGKDFPSGMPTELYKKEVTKHGTFNVDISELEGSELEIIGVIERFFTNGRWTSPDEEWKRLRLRENPTVELPGCVRDLKP